MRMDPRSFAAALAVERGSVAVGPGVLAIPLGRGKGRLSSVGRFALVSYEDRHLREFNWSVDRHGYPRRREAGTGKTIRMHREIMGMPPGKRGIRGEVVVDHINRDKLDNRRENLRVCTQAENMQNHSGLPNASSKYRGVSLRKSGKWYAYGTLNGKMHGLGEYADEGEAARVAAEWRAKHMPFAA